MYCDKCNCTPCVCALTAMGSMIKELEKQLAHKDKIIQLIAERADWLEGLAMQYYELEDIMGSEQQLLSWANEQAKSDMEE